MALELQNSYTSARCRYTVVHKDTAAPWPRFFVMRAVDVLLFVLSHQDWARHGQVEVLMRATLDLYEIDAAARACAKSCPNTHRSHSTMPRVRSSVLR